MKNEKFTHLKYKTIDSLGKPRYNIQSWIVRISGLGIKIQFTISKELK